MPSTHTERALGQSGATRSSGMGRWWWRWWWRVCAAGGAVTCTASKSGSSERSIIVPVASHTCALTPPVALAEPSPCVEGCALHEPRPQRCSAVLAHNVRLHALAVEQIELPMCDHRITVGLGPVRADDLRVLADAHLWRQPREGLDGHTAAQRRLFGHALPLRVRIAVAERTLLSRTACLPPPRDSLIIARRVRMSADQKSHSSLPTGPSGLHRQVTTRLALRSSGVAAGVNRLRFTPIQSRPTSNCFVMIGARLRMCT